VADATKPPETQTTAIYVHVPYCASKCAYCSFYSHPDRDDYDKYLDALTAEWRAMIDEEGLAESSTDAVEIGSIFIGGGTPSVLGGKRLVRLLAMLREYGPAWAADIEVSIEVNPESTDEAMVSDILAGGINRISMGVQSFKDECLARLGRRTTRKQILKAYKAIRAAGCKNLSLDLMYGLPEQSVEDWIEEMQEAMASKTDHLSCYLLTPEENTVLYRLLRGGEITTPLDETLLKQYQATREIAISNGFEHYEISNFAKPGFHCRHNEGTWSRRPYLGLGPGAHSFNGEVRWRNAPDLDRYLEQLLETGSRLEQERYRLDSLDVAKELIMVCMRRSCGVRWDQIETTVENSTMQRVKQRARFLSGTGFLQLNRDGMRLSPDAYFVSNSVFVELMRALEEDKP
jgi:putative oxygen-independent coproporphyrinogen III oxidase